MPNNDPFAVLDQPSEDPFAVLDQPSEDPSTVLDQPSEDPFAVLDEKEEVPEQTKGVAQRAVDFFTENIPKHTVASMTNVGKTMGGVFNFLEDFTNIKGVGAEAHEFWDGVGKEYRPEYEDKTVEYYLGHAYESIVTMAPFLIGAGVAVATGTAAAVAATAATGAMAVGVGGDKYSELRAKGWDKQKAFHTAGLHMLAEFAGGHIPLGYILKKGGISLVSRLFKAGATEGLEEVSTEAMQTFIETLGENPDITWDEFTERAKDAFIMGGLAGAGMATVMHQPMSKGSKSQIEPSWQGEDPFAILDEKEPELPGSVGQEPVPHGRADVPTTPTGHASEFIPIDREIGMEKVEPSQTDTITESTLTLPEGPTPASSQMGEMSTIGEGSEKALDTAHLEKFSKKEIEVAAKTARAAGAVGSRAITPSYVSKSAKEGESVLDYGAGPKAAHTERLRKEGLDVTAHDFSYVEGVHDPAALTKKYDTVMASNVLNVQSSKAMLKRTLKEITSSVSPEGRAVFNYPASPRKMSLAPSQVKKVIKEFFGDVKEIRKGAAPLWEASSPKDLYTIGEGTGEIIGAAHLERMSGVKQADKSFKFMEEPKKGKWSFTDTLSALGDASSKIKRKLADSEVGRQAISNLERIAGTNSKASLETKGHYKHIYKGFNAANKKVFDRFVFAKRAIAISEYRPDIQHPLKTQAKHYQAWIDSLPEGQRKLFEERSEIYGAAMRSQLDKLLDEGIISHQEYLDLVEKGFYSPRYLLDRIDKYIELKNKNGKPMSVPDSGIDYLGQGDHGKMILDTSQLLSMIISKTEGRIARNTANRDMYKFLEENPGNGFGKVLEATDKTPTGHDRFSVMFKDESGLPQKKDMSIEWGLSQEWGGMSPIFSPKQAAMLGWLSGSKPLKFFATGINPTFAAANIIRDVYYALNTLEEYSSTLPVGLTHLAKDIAVVLPDVMRKEGRYLDYINEGGGMEFLTTDGHFIKEPLWNKRAQPVRGALDVLEEVLGYAGHVSELTTRLAVREVAMRNGKTAKEATMVARGYIDFNQGNRYIKAADVVVPYLSASVQGTRGVFRAFKRNPKVFLYKQAQMGALAYFVYQNLMADDELYDGVSDYDKENNYIFPLGWYETDKDGQKRHAILRKPKDHGQKLVSTLFEGIAAHHAGKDFNWKRAAQSARSLIPLIPEGIPIPVLSALAGYWANFDFYRYEDTWKGPDINPVKEKYSHTSPLAVAVGEATGTSPVRLEQALGNFGVTSNPWTTIAGGLMKELLQEAPEETKREFFNDIQYNVPMVRRFIKFTDPMRKTKELLKDKNVEARTKGYETNQQFYSAMRSLEDKNDPVPLRKFMLELPKEMKSNFIRKFKDIESLGDIKGNKHWWGTIKRGATPEVKAYMFYAEWAQSPPEKRAILQGDINIVRGIRSKRFVKEVTRLLKQHWETDLQ